MCLVWAVAVLTLDAEELARVGVLLWPGLCLLVPSRDVAVPATFQECFLGVNPMSIGCDVVECACRVDDFDTSRVSVGSLHPCVVFIWVAHATELGALVFCLCKDSVDRSQEHP